MYLKTSIISAMKIKIANIVWSSCVYYSNWIIGRTSRASLQIDSALRAGHFSPIGQQYVDKLNDRPCFRLAQPPNLLKPIMV